MTSGASAEAPLPEAVADDGDRAVRPAAASIVLWREGAAQNRRGAEDVEEPTARPDAVDQFRLTACGEVESGRRPRCRAVERLLAIPDRLPDGVGPRASIDHHEPLRLFHRQRAKDQAVEDREDCGVCPDPKRQRKNGDNRHNRCSDEGTEGVTQVLHVNVRRCNPASGWLGDTQSRAAAEPSVAAVLDPDVSGFSLSLRPKRMCWIRERRAPRREIARGERHTEQQRRCGSKTDRIERRNAEQQTLHRPREGDCSAEA